MLQQQLAAFPKVDAHIHYNVRRPAIAELAKRYGFELITINTEIPFFPPVVEQMQVALEIQERYPDLLHFVGTFEVRQWHRDDWVEIALASIDRSLEVGACAIKVWKNIGMELRDSEGAWVMIDDPRFDPVFEYLVQRDIVVLGHLGEPRNCWLPLEEMTTEGDRHYFSRHPEYHMHLHPEMPSYQQQLDARDSMLAKHPKLRFIGAHFASLEWDIDQIAAWLDLHPHCAVDVSARMPHIERQATDRHAAVRDFFVKYRRRILYGTDVIDYPDLSDADICERFESRWLADWTFLATDQPVDVPGVASPTHGLDLPEEVLADIYANNAARWLLNRRNDV